MTFVKMTIARHPRSRPGSLLDPAFGFGGSCQVMSYQGTNAHSSKKCAAINDGQGRCPIHLPSGHPLVARKGRMRADFHYLIERQCEHGEWHPDPDSVWHLQKSGKIAFRSKAYKDAGRSKRWAAHACDGCCGERKGKMKPPVPKTQWTYKTKGTDDQFKWQLFNMMASNATTATTSNRPF